MSGTAIVTSPRISLNTSGEEILRLKIVIVQQAKVQIAEE